MFRNTSKIDILLLLLLLFSAVAIYGTFLQIALHIVLPIVFVLVIYQNRRNIFANRSLKSYLLLIMWLFIASIFAYDKDVAMRDMIKILSAFLCSLTTYHLAKNHFNQVFLYIIIIACFCSMMYYASTNIGFNIALQYQDRLQDEVLNANMFAYSLFYASFAVYFLLLPLFKKSRIFEMAIILGLISVSVWISLMTASRQVLYLQIPLLFCLYALDKFKLNFKTLFIISTLLIIIATIGLPLFDRIYSDSLLAQRSSVSLAEDSRSVILLEAIKCGLSHPIFGVGPSNFVLVNQYHIFSHNCYAELFAGGGFIALFLYLSIIFYNLKTQWKRYKKSGDLFYLYHLVFQLFFIVDNLLYVQINSIWLMAFYFISVGHSDYYYKENNFNILN